MGANSWDRLRYSRQSLQINTRHQCLQCSIVITIKRNNNMVIMTREYQVGTRCRRRSTFTSIRVTAASSSGEVSFGRSGKSREFYHARPAASATRRPRICYQFPRLPERGSPADRARLVPLLYSRQSQFCRNTPICVFVGRLSPVIDDIIGLMMCL